MRNSSLATLVVAIFLGLIAVAVINKKIAGSKVAIPMVEVLVASQNLTRGVEITAEMIEKKQVAEELVGSGSIRKPEEALERMLLAPVSKGEVITENRLGPKGENGLAVQIKNGMRAFTIETPKLSSGVGGMIQPGNHVDVILTMTEISATKDSDFSGGGSSSVLLQNVEVLAVDRRTDAPTPEGSSTKSSREPKDTKSVTLLVTPDQSAQLTLGQTKGTLYLSLRHPNDASVAQTRPATLREMQISGPDNLLDRLKSTFLALGRVDPEPARKQQPEAATKPALAKERPAMAQSPDKRPKRVRIMRGQIEELVIFRAGD